MKCIFVEISWEQDHVHFLVQSVPSLGVEKMIRTIKSIIAKELFRRHPEIKQKLWGWKPSGERILLDTVGRYRNIIRQYVKK